MISLAIKARDASYLVLFSNIQSCFFVFIEWKNHEICGRGGGR
jgi:hypothetical protein